MKKLSKLLLFGYALALLLVSSCLSKTDELDLNKDIKLDLRIAPDGMSIPFGDLKRIYLDSLIDIDDEDPDALIKKIDGTQYGISMYDEIEKTTINIDAITFDIANPSIIDSKSNNTLITLNGLPSIIEVPFSKDVDLGGGIIKKIEKTFNINAKEEGLTINPDGTFSDFDYDVVIDTTINGIKIQTISETITVKGSDYQVPNTTISVTIPTNTTNCGFTYNGFPADVEKINYITFANPGASDSSKGQLINIDIDLKEIDKLFYDPQYRIKSLKIEFPSSFVLGEDPDYEYNGVVENGNVFKVSMGAGEKLLVNMLPDGHTADPSNPTVIPLSFYLKRANINQGPDVPNGTVMTFDGDIKYDVELEIKGIPNLIGSKDIYMSMGQTQNVTTLNVRSMDIKAFEGKVYPKIDPIRESVSLDLDDDMDFLQDGANSLTLSNPQISLKLTSTIPFPMKLDLRISSKNKSGEFIGQNIRPDDGTFTLPAFPSNQNSNTTTIVLYKSGTREASEGSDSMFVKMSNFSDLMTTIPDSIIFNLEAMADTTEFDITKELSVSGSFDVTIPLKFDSLYFEYKDTIDEMAEDLEDIADKVTNIHMKLVADVYSTVPLGIEVSAIPIDLSGDEITSGITISSCKIAAGTEDNEVMSELSLEIDVTDGKLSILDGLIIKAACKVDQTENGAALRSDEYLDVKNVRLRILDGIDIDLTDK